MAWLSGLLAAKAGVLLLWAGLFAAGERLWPAATRPPGARRIGRNLGLWALSAPLAPLWTAPITVAAVALAPWERPVWGPAWAMLLADLLLLDLWIYAWHRANHEVPALWRFHQVHHRDAFLDVTSGLRFHAGEIALSALARGVFLAAAAVPLSSVLAFDLLVTAAALFHHSNLRLPARLEAGLRLAIVTPSHHWVHHHAARADTDSNYATLLTLWDRLFATFSPTARTPDMPIGLEGAPDLPFTDLALLPFHPQRMALSWWRNQRSG